MRLTFMPAERVQTSEPRANAIKLFTLKLKKQYIGYNTFLSDSAVSQQWLSNAQHEKYSQQLIL